MRIICANANRRFCKIKISYQNLLLQDVSKESLSLWFNYFASQPRAASLLADKHNLLVGTLREAMARYLGEVKTTLLTPDKRDPEFVFYNVAKATLNIYR